MILKIINYPDPRLSSPSSEVIEIDDQTKSELDDMIETMYASNGVGLAAVQVGIMKTMLVMDTAQREGEKLAIKMINPKIIWSSPELSPYEEGCLSFPGEYVEIDRPSEVKVKYLNENGQEKIYHATGLASVCVQHEIDHLHGITFIEHASRLKKSRIIKKMHKLMKDD